MILTVVASRLPPLQSLTGVRQPVVLARRPARDVVMDYVSLCKPRIIPLLLVTALGGMMMAQRGWPSTGLVVLTLLGGALAAAGAGAINCWIDRDLDAEMLRTRRRPLPDGRIAPTHALLFGIGLGMAAFVLLAFWVNVLAATLAISGNDLILIVPEPSMALLGMMAMGRNLQRKRKSVTRSHPPLPSE